MTEKELQDLLARGSSSFRNANQVNSSLSHPKPKRDQASTLDRADAGKKESLCRPLIRFTGYRVRPLDPDNFAGSIKDLLDGLRHAQLISGDEPWKIVLQTEQVKVRLKREERTEIEITYF